MPAETKTMTETQPLDGWESQIDSQPEKHAWGRLVPLTQHKNASNIELHDDLTVFGRAGSCDHVLENPGISGRHCTLRREAISGQRAMIMLFG